MVNSPNGKVRAKHCGHQSRILKVMPWNRKLSADNAPTGSPNLALSPVISYGGNIKTERQTCISSLHAFFDTNNSIRNIWNRFLHFMFDFLNCDWQYATDAFIRIVSPWSRLLTHECSVNSDQQFVPPEIGPVSTRDFLLSVSTDGSVWWRHILESDRNRFWDFPCGTTLLDPEKSH